jgi:uncharacterized protein YgbK (DUF1537 family)
MIAVIADDFTGAAEIGGVGLRYGLRVVIDTTVQQQAGVDLLIIATNSRSLKPDEASSVMEKISQEVLGLKPDFMFKKLDSVLRGNIAREINAQLSVLGKKKALLVPGNPDLGRITEKGLYYVNGIPLNQTFFASSSDYPRDSASVVDIIGRNEIPVISINLEEDLPESGIIVGDVSSQLDLARWAQKLDNKTMAAGGAGFFDVILANNFIKQHEWSGDTFYLDGRSLFVMGSRYPKDKKMIDKINGNGLIRMNMPEEIYRNRDFAPELLDNWADEIIHSLERSDKVLVTIDYEFYSEPGLNIRIRKTIGRLIKMVMDRSSIDNLLIEGGATTYEILQNMNITRLYPFCELGLGIIQMRVEKYPDLCIITKPGSYNWPDNVEFTKRVRGA